MWRTGARRLAVGSANLTHQAFSGDIKQYEDVMLFDFDGESELFSVYLDRFEKLRALTVDFVPEDHRKKFLEGELVKVVDMSDDDRTDELMRPDSNDYLAAAREIFAEYYAEAGRVRPAYFPVEPFRDYMSRGRDIWRRFYKQKQDDFKYSDDDEDSEPMFDVSLKDPDLLKEATGHFVTIRARPFLEWIGVEEARGGFWSRLFGRRHQRKIRT